MKRSIIIIGGMLGLVNVILGATNDPAPKDYMWGQPLNLPLAPRENVFKPEANKANFTFFDGADKVRVEEGTLKFTLTTNKATLGWGNYKGKQPLAEMVQTPEYWSVVELKVRQSGTPAKWSLRCWRNGKRDTTNLSHWEGPAKPIVREIMGGGWTNLVFGLKTQPPDGLEIEIEGEPGATVEIAQLKAIAEAFEGYFRKEFDLPAGQVWQALAQVGGWGKVFINGREVTDRLLQTRLWYGLDVTDIRPFLKPGKNVIAVYGIRYADGFFMFQCRIGMDSGVVIPIQTDVTWKYSSKAEPGWEQAAFDDTQWGKAVLLRGFLLKYLSDNFAGNNQHHSLGVVTRLRNPAQKEFLYPDDQDVVFEVLAPAGLKDQAPVVEYTFAATDAEGKSVSGKSEQATQFETKGDSLVFRISAGKHASGVYTVAAALKTKAGVVEERWREPLMVLRTFKPKVIEGKDYFDGLDVELEDTIDFTDPKDPHPWFSAKPGKAYQDTWTAITNATIVQTNGLTYRVTDPKGLAYFAYRIEFKHPGSWYLFELEYPDDADRETLVQINPAKTGSWSEAGVGYKSGYRNYPTGQMQKLHWLHGADSGVQILFVQNVENAGGGAPAAAKGVKIFRVQGALPSIGGGSSRQFGILTERCQETSGFAHNFGSDLPDVGRGPESTAKYSMLEQRVRFLRFLQETAEKYAQYLKFSGQNTFIMGMFQYGEGNSPFQPPYTWDTVEIMPELRTVLANVLDRNGLNLYLNFQFCTFKSLSTTATDAEVARGADTVWRVNEFGEQQVIDPQGGNKFCLQNWLHPKIQARFHDIMGQFADKFGHLKAFKGVRFCMNLATGLNGYYMPGLTKDTCYQDPLLWSYDDVTFAQFEKDTGIQLHLAKDDPQRFQKRAMAIKNEEVRKRYIAWRCEAVQKFYANTLTALRKRVPDAVFILELAVECDDLFRYWLSTGRDYGDWLKDYAVDISLLDATPGIAVGRWTYGIQSQLGVTGEDPYLFLPKTDPRVVHAYNNGALRHVLIRTSWHETVAASGGNKIRAGDTNSLKDNWIPNYVTLRALPQLSGANAREGFIQTLITGDPNSVTYGLTDINLNVGHEQEIRELMKIVTRLPPERFQPVLNTGLDTNLAIRKLIKDGKTWFYVANPGYWSIEGHLTLTTKAPVKVFPGGRPAAVAQKEGKIILPVRLTPYNLLAFQADTPEVTIESFATGAITDRERAHMEGMLVRVEQLLMNPEVKLVLTPDDFTYMDGTVKTARLALEKKEYAKAWYVITQCRFWLLWKHYLEMAEQALVWLPKDVAKEDQPVTEQGLRVLTAGKAAAPIQVDGKPDEQDWRQVKYAAGFLTKDRLPGMAETGVKALYDDQNLYLAFACADRDVGALKGDERWAFIGSDALVVFFQPDEGQPVYYQLGFNWAGTQFYQKVMAGERIYAKLPGWKAACAKNKGYWTAEAVFPYEMFGLKGKGTGPWRIQCHRIVRDQLADNSSWYFDPGGQWHDPSVGKRQPFGRLAFQ